MVRGIQTGDTLRIMKQAYTPALQVVSRTRVTKVRELPLPGESLVGVGERVTADTPVLSAELPGDLTIVRVADRMGFEPLDVVPGMKVGVGDKVKKGDLLCEIKTFFNLFTTELKCPADGVVEFFTEANAHLGIRHAPVPLSVNAYIDGTIIEVEEGKAVTVETEGSFIQGIFGVGGERHGRIAALPFDNQEVIDDSHIRELGLDLGGKILVGGGQFSESALREAATLGVSAVVTGSIDAQTLSSFVGSEIGVAITGDEEVPFTLIITEGFGRLAISSRVMELARELQSRSASVNGATQVRAGATRPEIIAPLDQVSTAEVDSSRSEAKILDVGSRIRVIRVPYFGLFGTITDLPHAPQQIPSGAKVRVLRTRLDNGQEVVIPRANVELI